MLSVYVSKLFLKINLLNVCGKLQNGLEILYAEHDCTSVAKKINASSLTGHKDDLNCINE